MADFQTKSFKYISYNQNVLSKFIPKVPAEKKLLLV